MFRAVSISSAALTAALLLCLPSAAPAQEKRTEPTADSQGQKRPDIDVTKSIRRALMKDKALSTAAHNVKVITKNGAVTLRGRVKSEEEKSAVMAKAVEVAGAGNVTNELEVGSLADKHPTQ